MGISGVGFRLHLCPQITHLTVSWSSVERASDMAAPVRTAALALERLDILQPVAHEAPDTHELRPQSPRAPVRKRTRVDPQPLRGLHRTQQVVGLGVHVYSFN